MNGWLIIDKPAGITSNAVIGKVKRIFREKLGKKKFKIGHAGTLDPFATGVLPLAIGEATKLMQYLVNDTKTYQFTAVFGKKTDTDDIDGKVIATSEKIPSKTEVKKIIPEFTGEIDQVPPIYSAIKVNGERAYDLAREGKEFELKARKVTVHKLELLGLKEEKAEFIMNCSKGTYVRSIAKDLAGKLGAYAYVESLRRLQVGKFLAEQAISLDKLEELVYKDAQILLPIESVLDDIPVISLESKDSSRLKNGQKILADISQTGIKQIWSDGTLQCLADFDGKLLKPVKVFNF